MKVKDFVEWFADFDPESELKFDLFEVKDDVRWHKVIETPLNASDISYLDKTNTVFVTFEHGD